MARVSLLLWILLGTGVVCFGILKRRTYGYITALTVGNWLVIAISIIIWPVSLVIILKFIKKEEQIMSEVIKEHPKYTRDMLIRGGRIWRNTLRGR